MKKRFQILSLDGGGIRGIFSAAILAAIEDDLKINITDHFDLITGTSTGGIIALGLGMGLKPKEIVEFYNTKGLKIFPRNLWRQYIQSLLFSKYSQGEFIKELKSVGAFCKNLGDSSKRLVIPSYNLGEDDVYIFKTPHHERLTSDYKIPAWQIAISTSAAPTYMPVSRLINSIRLIDGAIWANNPIMVGVIEAISMLNISTEDICVLSLGTSDSVVNYPHFLNKAGVLPWSFFAHNLFLSGQSTYANNQAIHLLGKEKVVRINPKVPNNVFQIDNINKKNDLIAKAAHESRKYMPVIQKVFTTHVAAKYEPLYK